MDIEQRRLIKKYLDILLRRKNIIVLCLLLGISFGLAQYLKTPKVYRSSALLKYQRQSVNPTVMSPDDIRTQTRDVVDTVSQQIMSRTSLEAIIKEFDLYPGMQQAVPMEHIVDIMRKNHIQTQFLQRGDVFEVSYQGSDQNKVLRVTNALAAKFIEENLRIRQELASQTSIYVRDELEMAKESLDKKEILMRDYKLKYYNEMPEQLVNNMNRLSALQVQYQTNQTSSHEMERTRLLVQEQISSRLDYLAQLSAQAALDTADSSTLSGGLNDIYQLRLKLQNLQSRYTEKHPEIKRLKKTIQDLEARHGVSPEESANQPDGSAAQGATGLMDPQLQDLRNQSKELEVSIARLKEEREILAEQINQYEKWIAAAPVREAEWSALTRDYEQLNEHYQRLVTLNLQADSAQSLENQLEGSQFKIIDPAHFPEKPFKPDFKKIMLLAAGIGLAAGGGIALGIELLGTSFRDPVEMEAYLNVPVVCAIPTIYTQKELAGRKAMRFIWYIILLLALGSIITAAGYFWKQGMIIL